MSKIGTFFNVLFVRLRFILVFVVVGLLVGNWSWIMNHVDRRLRPPKASDLVSGDHEWFCPMHPSVVRNDPDAKCPICGMPLSKRKKGEKAELPAGVLGRVTLTSTRVHQTGVATEEVGYKTLVREIRTVGMIEWDERKFSHPSARVAGRVDEIYVNYVGARIKKGDPLYQIYSPDLSTTQEEYLLALKSLEEMKDAPAEAKARSRRLADSARERLRLWGVTEEQLAELERSRKPFNRVTVTSAVEGVVIKRTLDLGHYVAVGEDPMTLADDSLMWLQAEVFEKDMALVRIGQKVEITAEAYPGRSFDGTVAFLAPELSPQTRTLKVRVEVPNPERLFKAGMYVTATLRVPIGRQQEVFYGC